ncbi:MAG TPA: 6-carboxytetrahydropterin synthase QueD [Desulfobacteraceae bacterium]|nr:6-carboxytetrahydropterin synthase QueD [Deltaproteobacteria bacterium]HDI60516.1 6-carboxytetrahydropterin synthase QueD [Desulfobacteraceae bacterium]
MYELKIVTRFAAAHQLRMVASKCENLHGHNWKIEVCVHGKTLDQSGVVMDFGVIKAHVREIIQRLDHCFLNELEWFGGQQPPSSENIARFIAEQLAEQLADAPVQVASVSAWESDDACATYFP